MTRIKFRIREQKHSNALPNALSYFYAEKLKIGGMKPEWLDITHDTGKGAQIFLSYADAYNAIEDYRQELLGKRYPEELIYDLPNLSLEIDLPKEEPEILHIDGYNYTVGPVTKKHFMNFTNWIRFCCDVHDNGVVFLKNSVKCFYNSDELYKYWNITVNKKDNETNCH
jgi:hypothetical protein